MEPKKARRRYKVGVTIYREMEIVFDDKYAAPFSVFIYNESSYGTKDTLWCFKTYQETIDFINAYLNSLGELP